MCKLKAPKQQYPDLKNSTAIAPSGSEIPGSVTIFVLYIRYEMVYNTSSRLQGTENQRLLNLFIKIHKYIQLLSGNACLWGKLGPVKFRSVGTGSGIAKRII